MELVQEVRAAVHATANAEYAAWMEQGGGLDLAPLVIPGLPVEAWVVSPRAARPPVGVLVVRVGDSLVVTTGDAGATARVLATAQVADPELPAVLFELLRSRARPMALVERLDATDTTRGAQAPTMTRTDGGWVVHLSVTRGALAPEAWTLTWTPTAHMGGQTSLAWTRTPLPAARGGGAP